MSESYKIYAISNTVRTWENNKEWEAKNVEQSINTWKLFLDIIKNIV